MMFGPVSYQLLKVFYIIRKTPITKIISEKYARSILKRDLEHEIFSGLVL